MCVIYFVWYFNVFFYYLFSKILATNIDSITSYSKIQEEIKFMYVCMCECQGNPLARVTLAQGLPYLLVNRAR